MLMMSNGTQEAGALRREDALARVPLSVFGENEWVSMAQAACALYLEPAIVSGQPHRIANALRAIMHVPNSEQRSQSIKAACDSLLADAYTQRNARMVHDIANARSVIDSVLADLESEAERVANEPALLRATVDGFVRMAALVDRHLADRLDATGRFAARIATAMHLSKAVVTDIEFAGCLHDIGMISLPVAARAKDGLHGRKERGFRSHAIIGESFVRDIAALAHLAPIVRSHHERFDGTGFPDGLRGDEIPLESRVISVAAAFVERVAATPDHEAKLPAEVCQELASRAGTAFDPDVIAATFQLLRYGQRTNRSA